MASKVLGVRGNFKFVEKDIIGSSKNLLLSLFCFILVSKALNKKYV